MSKKVALFLCLVMVFTVVFGCAAPTPAPAVESAKPVEPAKEEPAAPAEVNEKPYEGVTLRILSGNQPNVEKILYPNLQEFTDLTGIIVEMEIMGNDDYANKVAIELAAQNKDLDLISLRPLTDFKQYLKNGWLADISEIRDDEEFDIDDYFPSALESATKDGKLYGVPIVAESQILYYRKDILAEKGLAVPTTLEELRQVAEAINDPKNDFYGFFMRGKANALVTQFSSVLYSFGGRFNTDTESLLNTEAFSNATAYFGDILKNCAPPGAINMTWTEGCALFAQGKLGMFMDSDAIFGNISGDANAVITADQIGFAVIPAGVDGVATPFYATVNTWSVPAFTDKKAAALEFIKWAESKEMGVRFTKEVQSTGCRNSVWNNADAMASFDPDMLAAMLESRGIAVSGDRPTVINVGEARDIISVPIQAAMMGKDYTKLLEEAHTKFQELIDKENQ